MPPEVIRVREHQTFELPADKFMLEGRLSVYEEVQKRGYFQIRASGDRLIFQAGGSIGLIPINERLTIEVAPRTPIANLDRLLRIADADAHVIRRICRSYGETSEELSLLDVLCDELSEAVAQIAMEGRRKTYQSIRHLGLPRSGRILAGATLRASAKNPGRLTVATRRFERTANNLYNACIKHALERLAEFLHREMHQTKKGGAARLRRLNDAWQVVSDADIGLADSTALPGLRSDLERISSDWYRRAVAVSIAILDNRRPSADNRTGQLVLASVIYDLSDAFERYVRKVLSTRVDFQVLDGNVGPPEGARTFLFSEPAAGEAAKTKATPDLVLEAAGKKWCAVDVKYKPYSGVPGREDINQVLTYGLVYDVDVCLLVYPATALLHGLQRIGRVGSKTVYCYGFDLMTQEIIGEEDRFAADVVRLIPV
jgi:5-methylcytosine-specific restriction enzyme subunit McrC